MNLPIFFGSKENEHTQELLDEVYKKHYDMGVSYNKKVELSSYQLNDVAPTWYTWWRDNKDLREVTIDWNIFRRSFVYRFFPKQKKEVKVDEFSLNSPYLGRNSFLNGISVQDYSFKITKFSKYGPYLVSNRRDKMRLFVMGVYDDLVVDSHFVMLQ